MTVQAKPQPTADERSFERLYREHRGDVYRFALRDTGSREEAEDVTQTAFLNAYNAYMRSGPPEKPKAWLFAIAQNVGRRRFRTQSRRPIETPLDEESTPAVAPESDLTAQEITGALAGLPFNQRAALVLREVSGLSYAEIADELALSVQAVQMLIFRARRSLRLELEPARARRRVVGGIFGLPMPNWLSRLLSPVASSVGRAGLLTKAAGVVGAAAVGTGALATSPGRAELPVLGGGAIRHDEQTRPSTSGGGGPGASAVAVRGNTAASRRSARATATRVKATQPVRKGAPGRRGSTPVSNGPTGSQAGQAGQETSGQASVVQLPSVELPTSLLGVVRPPRVPPVDVPPLPPVPPLPQLPPLPPVPPLPQLPPLPPVTVPNLPTVAIPPVSPPPLPNPPVTTPAVPPVSVPNLPTVTIPPVPPPPKLP